MKFVYLLLLAFILVGCGKNNKSGSGGGNPINTNPVITNPAYVGNASQQALLATVMNENPCMSGLQRITVQVPLNMSIAVNGFYVGVTSEGDIAVVSSNNGQGVFTGYVCARQSLPSGQGQLLGNPVVNRSYQCAVDEITAAKMSLSGMLMLNFRAIHFGHGSSLCH